MKYFTILFFAISLLYSCSKDDNGTNNQVQTVKIEIFFRIVGNLSGGIYEQGKCQIELKKGGSANKDFIGFSKDSTLWNCNVIYYNSLNDHKILIKNPGSSILIDVNSNYFSVSKVGGTYSCQGSVSEL